MWRSNRSNPFRQLLAATFDLLKSWWRVDRIRVSPNETRLFDLRPGSVTIIDNRPVEVLSRQVVMSNEGRCVIYNCQTQQGPASLRVTPERSGCASTYTWIKDDGEKVS